MKFMMTKVSKQVVEQDFRVVDVVVALSERLLVLVRVSIGRQQDAIELL